MCIFLKVCTRGGFFVFCEMIPTLRLVLFILPGLFTSQTSLAQIVKGNVKDGKTGAPLAFANVFLNNTTKGTVTDGKGEFLLKSLHEPGIYDLVVSFVGYKTYKTRIDISENEILSAEIVLVPSEVELIDVEVKASRDKVWEKRLKKFRKVFLGDDKLADSCKILNPWVIDFIQEKSGKMLAYAAAPIEIDNNALGYKVFFYLTNFWTDRTGYSIAGNVHFTEKLSLDDKERMQWQINRKISYLRSRHHLFKAIIDQRIRAEGFRLYVENGNESVNIRSSSFNDDFGKIVFPLDTTQILSPLKNGNYKISLKGRVEVHFHNQRAAVRTYRDVPYAVSWIRLNSNRVIVKNDGYEVNPTDVTVSGDMSTSRVSQMLPLNYKPSEVIPIKDADGDFLSQFQEKIYVHTNKSYYYAGEPIWFKGYINYSTKTWRDSLSQTVYTELISPEKEIVISKVLEIKDGSFHNDFILPNSLTKGTYYLRAYTNFNRNFSDSSLFIRPIALLDDTEKADPGQALSPIAADSLFTIVADKAVYRTREKVTLALQVLGDDGLPIQSNISIAVTDDQVVPVGDPVSILRDYPFEEKISHKNREVTYPVEYGLSFSGQFLNEFGKPELTLLNVFNHENFLFTQSDEKGVFSVKGLYFYDSALFTFKADRTDGKPYGKILLMERAPAGMDFKAEDFLIDLLKTKEEKPVITEYEVPKNARVLKELEIRAKRIEGEARDYRTRRPYGKPDHIITAKDINASYGDLLQILPGKVPGLIVRQVNNEGE
ncbi:MAG: hypothetical protein C0490_02065, partial [Marivirga sp.]|nr:hypothetical protein [Marivirga sp.]